MLLLTQQFNYKTPAYPSHFLPFSPSLHLLLPSYRDKRAASNDGCADKGVVVQRRKTIKIVSFRLMACLRRKKHCVQGQQRVSFSNFDHPRQSNMYLILRFFCPFSILFFTPIGTLYFLYFAFSNMYLIYFIHLPFPQFLLIFFCMIMGWGFQPLSV